MTCRRATLADVISWGPCEEYTEARIRRLFGRRKYMDALRIAALDIPVEDRIWAAIHLLDDRQQRLWGCDCAERALFRERDAGREPDPRSWEAIRVSRLYANGEATLEELAAARAAAGAAWSAADAAARAAAGAAWDAAGDARAAAGAAAWSAGDARAAEREWQLTRLVEYARGEA